MPLTNTSVRYGWLAQVLHWLIAAFVVCQFILAELAEKADEAGASVTQLALLANHKSLGLTVLALAIVRLLWRLLSPPPPLPATVAGWQVRAALIAHWALYALIFALPVSGWLYSSASAYSVSWFNVIALPDLVGPSETLAEVLEETHEVLAQALFLLAAAHMAAAIKHGLWNRDGVLGRMLNPAGLLLFAAALAAAFWTLMDVAVPAPVAGQAENGAPAGGTTASATPGSNLQNTLPAWGIDYARSSIRFRATQAGAPVQGRWQDWQAEIRFDPANLTASSAVVSITSASVDTADAERDAMLASEPWFDAATFATSEFATTSLQALPEGGYRAQGQLRIKNIQAPVTFDFFLSQTPPEMRLEGSARLDRLLFDLGTGEWRDTTWIGQYVDVLVTVVARP